MSETLKLFEVQTWDALARHLAVNYIDNKLEIERIDEAKKRDEYFDGGGEMGITRIIETAFKDPVTRALRKDLIRWAKWNNVIRRVASEIATVYSEPAKRSVADDEPYQEFLKLFPVDVIMRELDEKLVYHEDVWLQYRVRTAIMPREPVLDVVSPAKFWAVHHVHDVTHLVSIIIDQKCSDDDRKQRYLVWTAEESFYLDGAKRYMQETHKAHTLKRLPGVLVSMRPASAKGRLLTQTPAADLVAAHEAVWFLGVLLIKEAKSANKQLYHTGDTSTAGMGQSADTESDVILPEGVTTQAVDRGMDLSQYMETSTHIFEQAAANRGLPPSVLHQRDAASGAEIHLRRIPIRELRKKRIPILRDAERRIVEVESLINAQDLQEHQIIPNEFAVDFGEVQQPMSAQESQAVFEKDRQLGLTDTLEEIRKRNPDLSDDEAALAELEQHIANETKRIELMRDLMAMSGSMGAAGDGADKFQANRGEEKPDDEEEEDEDVDLVSIAKEILSGTK